MICDRPLVIAMQPPIRMHRQEITSRSTTANALPARSLPNDPRISGPRATSREAETCWMVAEVERHNQDAYSRVRCMRWLGGLRLLTC